MSKQRSSRSAFIVKRAARKRAPCANGGQTADLKVPPQKKAQYCDVARSQVLAAWPQILQGLIKKAVSGGYQQTKLLLDLCELATTEPLHSSQQSKEQLCDALLDSLRLPSPE